MSDYESITSAASRLGISQPMARRYCQHGRWPGAQKPGWAWIVPRGSSPSRGEPGRPKKNP
jgi:hypothetical protein